MKHREKFSVCFIAVVSSFVSWVKRARWWAGAGAGSGAGAGAR